MNKTDRIRADVAAHPGTTNKAIAERLDLDASFVAAITGSEFRAGRFTRKRASATISNVAIYAYWPAAKHPANVSKPLENVSKPAVMAPSPAAPKRKAPLPPLGLDALLDQFASAVALELTERIKGRLVEELQALLPQGEAVRPLLEEIKARVSAGAAPVGADKLPAVVIAGLLPQQAGLIQQEFHDAFRLAFWKDESPSQLKDMARRADHVVTFSGKLGHWVEDAIKSVGKEPRRVMGGMTQLRDLLMEIYVKEG